MYNAWIAVNKTIKADLATNPLVQEIMEADPDTVRRLFKEQQAGGKTYQLFTVYTNRQDGKEIEDIAAFYGNDLLIMAAWKIADGLQVGVSYVYDANGDVTGTTGTPRYPLSEVIGAKTKYQWLLGFMPNVNGIPATVITDVNILYGHPLRSFA